MQTEQILTVTTLHYKKNIYKTKQIVTCNNSKTILSVVNHWLMAHKAYD